MRIRNFRLSFNVGQLVNSLVTIGMTKTTLQWTCSFAYLLNLLRKNNLYTKFVEVGKGQSVYRLGFGPDGFGFEFLYRQELFLLFKTPIPAMESTYPPMSEVPGLFAGFNRPVRDVDHSTPTSRYRGEEQVEMYFFFSYMPQSCKQEQCRTFCTNFLSKNCNFINRLLD
jgi:hypothetical protein